MANDAIDTECDIAFVVVNAVMLLNATLLVEYLHSAISSVVTVIVAVEPDTDDPTVAIGATESATVKLFLNCVLRLLRSVQLTVTL